MVEQKKLKRPRKKNHPRLKEDPKAYCKFHTSPSKKRRGNAGKGYGGPSKRGSTTSRKGTPQPFDAHKTGRNGKRTNPFFIGDRKASVGSWNGKFVRTAN